MKILKILFLLPFFVFADEAVPIAVIGSGPAGLSSALITGRERLETHVFLGDKPGGPVNAVTCLGNWPGAVPGKGFAIVDRLFKQLEEYPVHFYEESIKAVDFSNHPFLLTTSSGRKIKAKCVIITPGSVPRMLGVKGEEQYSGKGVVTYLYKPDAPLYEGKTVAVVGGGIDAYKKVKILSKKAAKVYLIVRKPTLQKPFMQRKIEKLKDKVELFTDATVLEVKGDGEKMTHISIATPFGKRLLEIDALVLAVGVTPNTLIYKESLTLDENGYILLEGRSQKTNIPGVFAAGSATDPQYRQAAISAGDGMKAGYDAIAFLQGYSE